MYGTSQQESLTLIAAQNPEQGQLFGGFDAFGGDAERKRRGERDDAANDGFILAVGARTTDE
jgi:hypothetical protein